MRIVVDAMGSDGAPDPEIQGAIEASRRTDAEIVLVGEEATLSKALQKHPKRDNITIVNATQHVAMHDSPMSAVRTKKDSIPKRPIQRSTERRYS